MIRTLSDCEWTRERKKQQCVTTNPCVKASGIRCGIQLHSSKLSSLCFIKTNGVIIANPDDTKVNPQLRSTHQQIAFLNASFLRSKGYHHPATARSCHPKSSQVLRNLFYERDDDDKELDEVVEASLSYARSTRYAARAPDCHRRSPRWKKLLRNRTCLSKGEFLEHFRLERSFFFRLVSFVKDDLGMCCSGTKPFRGKADQRMMVHLT